MADNTRVNANDTEGDLIVTREISHGGDTAKLQGTFLMGTSGSEGSYTAAAINGDATNGLDVDVTRVGGTVTVDNAGTFAVQAAQSGSWTATVTNAGTFAVQAAQAGTWTVDLGTTDNAVLDAIAASVAGTLTVDNGGTFAVQAAQSGSWSAAVTGAAAENAAASGNPVLVGGRYDSSARTLGNGDAGALAVNASGQLLVEIAAGAGSGGTAAADDADFTAASTSGTPVMGAYQSSPTPVTDGDLGIVGITANRELKVSVTSYADSQTDDAAFTPGTDSVAMIGATFDDTTPDSVDEGDGGALRMSANRNLYVTLRDAAGNERGLNIDANGAIAVTNSGLTELAAAISTELQVDVVSSALPTGASTAANQSTMITALQLIDNPVLAHDAAVGSTQTMMAGARATNNIEGLTQVAANDGTRLTADLNGCLVTRPHSTLEEHISERVADTGGTSTAFTNFGAGGAGVHNYVMNVTITNTSATDGYVDIRDGTAGAVLWTFPAPANSGATHAFSYPLKGSANTALAYDVSAALTTVYISVNGFQAQG